MSATAATDAALVRIGLNELLLGLEERAGGRGIPPSCSLIPIGGPRTMRSRG
jgi:hypothetical protein